jgi:hypothetical protein
MIGISWKYSWVEPIGKSTGWHLSNYQKRWVYHQKYG